MIYGSVCSGIEAASVAWKGIGWKPSFFSEIEKFPREVLGVRYPEVPLHGDFTTIKGGDYEPINVLVGGTPCQSFSVAGLRKGLEDDRGNLALEYLKLAKRLRPRWLVWENVPGVLSSTSHDAPDPCPPPPPVDMECDGAEVETEDDYSAEEIHAINAFLAGLSEIGYGYALRVLDAQYFGVPQRRRRVFVVAYLGDWRPPAAVLFERHSLCGNTTPSREKREGVAGVAEKGASFRYQNEQAGIIQDDITATVRRESATTDERSVPAYVVHGTQDPLILEDKAFPLGRNNGQENVVLPIHDKATRFKGGGARQEDGIERNDGSGNGLGVGKEGDPCYTITSGDKHAIYYENHPQDSRIKELKDVVNTVSAKYGTGGGNVPLVQSFQQNASGEVREGDQAYTLNTNSNASGRNTGMVHLDSTVRRLTPVECERLQGFPDNYTQIPWRGKLPENCPDGPRYKALGNSMAVPVMRWIGERIQIVDDLKSS